MVKCPVPGCPVIIAPEKEISKHTGEQKGALIKHLKGEEEQSGWVGCKGHDFSLAEAREIAAKAVELSQFVKTYSKK